MSAFVLHDSAGDPKSIGSGAAPSPAPNGWTAKVITDAEFTGLTSGTHRWNPTTKAVEVDTARQQLESNIMAVRSQVAGALAGLQAIIDTPAVTFSNVTGAQTAMRSLQTQVKDEARLLRRLVRMAVDDYAGSD